MQTLLGPFHPYLEDALVEEILRHKKDRPLVPLLILVPSDALRRRLKILLARERDLNLLNLHILTFHQLSLRLLEERGGRSALSVQDNSLLEEILRRIIQTRLPGAEAFGGLEEKSGGCAALWQTLRDLKDGAVSPLVALEATRASLFEEAGEGVERLLVLFQTFLSCCEKWNFHDYADLDQIALEQAPSSTYLDQFNGVFYYGFYDLTQVQLDVFQAVARRYPTTLFFPLLHSKSKNSGWAFAQRFYERYLHGLGETRNLVAAAQRTGSQAQLSLFSEEPEKQGLEVQSMTIFSCFSGRDEVDTVAKEILRLVSEEKFSFDAIAVVGRTLEPYLPWLKEVFSNHCIPMLTSAEEPLVQQPLVKAVLLLAQLPLKGYVRSHVIDLFESSFFNARSIGGAVAPRPDLWDFVTRRFAIARGIEEWRRLERHLTTDLVIADGAHNDDESRKIAVPAGQVRALWELFSELYRDLESLPEEESWSGYVRRWSVLQEKWLTIPAAPDSNQAQAAEIAAEVLSRLASMDVVSSTVSLSHFLETYRHWLERATFPITSHNAGGVAVLDAMTARGMPFRALFIIGLNEGLFPRTIREDAFLRDRERELLETVLGYKVATKLGAFDEERLLFTLIRGAAKERLYCLHHRNDDDGRPVAPSWYLNELGRAIGDEKIKTVLLPRSTVEKSAIEPFNNSDLLPPQELAIRLILTSKDPMPLLRLCLPRPSLYQRGSDVTRRLEAMTDGLAEYDGCVGSITDDWRRVAEQGLSPTALEGYARCPFQFFAANLLGLERLERPEDAAGPGGADVGQIVHSVLKAFYEELVNRRFFPLPGKPLDPSKGSGQTPLPDSAEVAAILAAVTQSAFADFERDSPVGYPLAWDVLRERIEGLLAQVIAGDLAELGSSGYRPVAFECEASVRLPETWPAPLSGLMIRGRMDRIDYQAEENSYRVVDYKLKTGKSRLPADRDLLRSAMRGQRLQPPFYLLLGKQYAERAKRLDARVDAAFYFLAPQWPDGPLSTQSLPADIWNGPYGEAFKATVGFLVESIRQGLFFIQPDDHCRYCEVSEACRRNHRPTRWRAERDLRSVAHRKLEDKRANSDEGHR